MLRSVKTGHWWSLRAGSRQSAGCSCPASAKCHPLQEQEQQQSRYLRHSKVPRDERPEIYKGCFMSPCSSLDRATRRWDLSQEGDVLCMKVTAESQEARRAAVWLGAAGWARAASVQEETR